MSKKPKKRGARARAGVRRPAGRPKLLAALLSACALLLTAGFTATRFDRVRVAVGMLPLLAPVAQGGGQGSLPLAKEYIYAGGRLVATEEPTMTPTPPPAGPPPTNLVATASAISPPATTITVTWDIPSSGTPASYVVERASVAGAFQQVGQPVIAPATTFDDTSASEGSAYLYRVKALYAGGASGYSNADLATAVAFTDAPLQGAVIKATHLVELRRAVAAVRTLTGLSAASWTYPDPVSSPPAQRRKIYLEDVTELRARLDEALSLLGTQTSYPTNPTLERGAVVYAAHFEQIRDRVK